MRFLLGLTPDMKAVEYRESTSILAGSLIYINAANQASRFLQKPLIVKGFYLD
jgi:hypothetical protein